MSTFDRSKVIENPKTLPDGEYYFSDYIGNLQEEVENTEIEQACSIRNNILETVDAIHYIKLQLWKYYYPVEVSS